jgi:signal transduction histidine kinase/ligand-binding sensor domain-containing protein/DNA-binding response OmpR family regulator
MNIFHSRRFVTILLSVVLTFVGTGEVWSAPFTNSRTYTVDNGLSSNCVYGIVQDEMGFIWFGTKNGLCRFDSREFRCYYHSESDPTSISSNSIRRLTIDSRGWIWISLDYGVDIYDPETDCFRHLGVLTKDGVGIDDQTIEIIEDNDGDMWISTVDSGLFRYSPEDNRLWVYTHDPEDENSISQNYISTLYKSRDGVIWIGTYSEGLCSFSKDSGTFTRYKKTGGNSISDNSIDAICEDSYGNLWLGTVNNGIDRFDRTAGVFTNFNDKRGEGRMLHIHSMSEITPGELLVCANSGASLFQITETGLGFKNNANTNFTNTRINYVFSFLKDREGNLWFGSTNDGVEFYPAYNNFICHPTTLGENSTLGRVVNAVCEYGDDTYLIGTSNNGILLYDDRRGEVRPFRTARDAGTYPYNIFSLLMDDETLWVATYQQGVEAINPKTGRIRKYLADAAQPYSRVFSLLRSSTGRIYAGTSVGLYYYNRAADDFAKVDIPLNSRILGLTEDQSGRIWAATAENGVHRYDPKTGEHRAYHYGRNDPTSISRNTTITVAVDRSNRVWVGTNGYGICRYEANSDSFVRYEDLALPNGIVSHIIPDGDYLWIATEKGLAIYNPDTGAIKTYSASDGIHNEQFRQNAGIRTSDGQMILGSADGICTFAPRDIIENKYAPPVVITSLSVNNHTVRPAPESSPLTVPVEKTRRITLSHKQSFVGMRFASLSYISPNNNQYRYRLDGLDKEWHTADDGNATVNYNLNPGDYLFRVQGSNSDMVWSPAETTLAIRVRPPLLASNAAFVIYGVLGAIALILLILYLLRRSDKKHREKMAQLEAEKERMLYDTRLDFFTNIAHEIRTPLSLIIGPLEYVMKSRNIVDKYGDYLSVIEQNYRRLYNLVGELLDFRKVDAGSYTIKYGECDVAKLAGELVAMFEPTILQKNMRLVTDIGRDDMTIVTDGEAFTKIVSNLLTNAIKYAEREIRLRIWRDGEGIGIEVSDDGQGIPPEERDKVFDAFYQVKSSNSAGTGVGIGLHMTRTFVRLMGGDIAVEERRDGHSGTVIVAHIPQPDPASVVIAPTEKQLKEYIAEEVISEDSDEDEEEDENTPEVVRRATIMVIDDNAEILDFLAKILGQDWFVISATSAEDALKLLQNNEPDLIVSDIMMDGMDGIELCRRIKGDLYTCHIPTVLLTAKTDVGTKIESLDCGADAYIEKPFSPDHLKAQLRNLLRKRDEVRRNFVSTPLTEIRTTVHNRLDEEFIEKTRAVIIENMSNPALSVDLLARELAVSRTSIFKKLKAITGMTPNDFMKLVRLKEASRMIVEGEYRITEIGFITGFSSSSYFAKCFLKQFGILPTEFVKSLDNPMDKEDKL